MNIALLLSERNEQYFMIMPITDADQFLNNLLTQSNYVWVVGSGDGAG